MTYDAERRLAHWQNTPSSPVTQDDFLYDGSGQRVMQYINVNNTITTTAYLLGGVEESTGGVFTKYLGVAGLPSAVRVGSTLSYLTTDGLGSVSESFDTSGAETATQLFAPYGTVRYAANSMPTTRGYTGQQTDVTTGLDYYVARYYDPQAGQFTSADSVSDGLSPYAYVAGNPETATDPTGHVACAGQCSGGGGCYSACVSPANGSYSAPPQPWWQAIPGALNPASIIDGALSGYAVFNVKMALKAADSLNEKTQYVSGSWRNKPYFRRPAGNAALAEEAGEAAEHFDHLGIALGVVGFLIDAVSAGVNFYAQDNPNDPARVQKAVFAGTAHALISTGVAVGFSVAVAAIPIVGESGIAEVGAGIVGGMFGGWLADQVVTPSSVDATISAANTVQSDVSSVANTVANWF